MILSMLNFTRELAKANKRFPKSYSHFSGIPFLVNILEDKIFLDRTLDDCVFEAGNFNFSLTFLSDLRAEMQRNLYFVLDGTLYWYEKFNLSGKSKLVRCPSLAHTMYKINKDDYEQRALSDNPWILTSFNYSRPNVNIELTTSVNKVRIELEAACRDYLQDVFMPRGVWGIDYMFKLKQGCKPDLKFGPTGKYQLTPLDKYLERVINY